MRHIWNRSIVRRVYPMYGLRLGDLVRVSHDGGLDCHVVIGSECVAPNGYIIPNNCKQHCSDVPLLIVTLHVLYLLRFGKHQDLISLIEQ